MSASLQKLPDHVGDIQQVGPLVIGADYSRHGADSIPVVGFLVTGWDAEFLAKRLGRVARLAGVSIPEGFTHEQLAEAAGTILGQIAAAMETKPANHQKPANDVIRSCKCGWTGSEYDCVLCGSVGPLCPECQETTEIEQQPDDKDRLEAERYRLLRDNWWFCGGHENIRQALTPDELDAEVDKAIALTKGGLALAIMQIQMPPNYGEIYGRGEKKKHAGRPMSALRRARGDALLAISEEVGEGKTVDDLMPFIRAGSTDKGRAPDLTLNRDDARKILDELVEAGLMTKAHKTIGRHRRSFYSVIGRSA